MGDRYEVTHVPHYIGQRWREPGETVELPAGVKPGRWLKPLASAAAAVQADDSAAGAEQYRAKHNGGGNWLVERIENGARSSVIFKKDEGDAKAKAEAEAARLNAGGEVELGGTDAAPSSAQGDPAAGAEQSGALPDA